MRSSMELPSPSVTAQLGGAEWSPETLAARPQLRLESGGGCSAFIGLRVAGKTLELAVLGVRETEPKNAASHPEWYFWNHAVLFLNPGHDHATRWMYALDETGAIHSAAEWIAPGEEPGETVQKNLPPPPGAQGVFRQLDARRFFACLQVPLEKCLIQEGLPLGLSVKVAFKDEFAADPLCWPAPPELAKDVPMLFGDVWCQEPLFRAEVLGIPAPAWGDAGGVIGLKGDLAVNAPREGVAIVETILPDDPERFVKQVPWSASSQKLDLRLPVCFSPRAKWANDVLKTARLKVTLAGPSRRILWSAEYPFGFDCGIIVREKFGPRGESLPRRPGPSAPDFVERFREYVLARIPDYRWRTTRNGAPSDFYLEDPSGAASVNLMDADYLDQVAGMIAARFPDWRDALCAVAMWIYHPCVSRHSAAWSRISGLAGAASVPRLGGCFCGDTCRVGACLAEKTGARLGVNLQGYSMGLRGHLATLVATPEGRVVIDGMMGLWYHTLDNKRLATLEEMRADAAISQRMWFCPRAHGHEFFYGYNAQIIRRWKDIPFQWPE